MAVKAEKVLSVLYSSDIREKLKTLIALISDPSQIINLSFETDASGTWISVDGKRKDKLRIHLGGQDVKKMSGMPNSFVSKASMLGIMKTLTKHVYLTFWGLTCHELGHAKYTDMKSTEISLYPEAKYRGFMHKTFNILEDIVIEYSMEMFFKKEHPYDTNPRVYFNFIVKSTFEPQGNEYEDDKTQNGFLNYLLLTLRIGEKKIKNRCEIFDKYRDGLLPLIKDVLREPDGTQRIHKTVILCEWIIKNITEFSWEMPEPKESEKISGRTAGTPIGGSPSSAPVSGKKGPSAFAPSETPGTDKEGADAGEEEEEGEEEDEKEPEKDEVETEEEKGKEEEDEEDEEEEHSDASVDSSLSDDVYDTVFNDVIRDGDDHEWVIAKDEYEIIDSALLDEIDKILERQADLARSVSDYFTLFQGRVKPRMTEGMTSGRLSPRRAIRDEIENSHSLHLFKRPLPRGKSVDAAFYLLIDQSGSMDTQKAKTATEASLTLAQACDWSNIPFEAACFTKTRDSYDGISITIVEKSFEDSFEESKPYFGLNSKSLIGYLRSQKKIPTFCGNSEEVNIYYIWQKLKKVKHKTKILFVLCDGGTTGSRANLREVVSRMEEEDGIIVIGIGVLSSDVVGIYNHVKVFSTQKELDEGLAAFLVETLDSLTR